MKGISAIIATIILLVMTIGLATLAYMYFRGTITGVVTKLIRITGGSCDAEATTGYYVVVKNLDPTNPINTSHLSVFVDGALASASWDPATIPPDGGVSRGSIAVTGGAAGTTHTIRVVGPANEDSWDVICE